MRTLKILVLAAGIAAAGVVAAQPAAQKSEAAGMVVTVRPADLAPGTKTWDFAVMFDTHTQEVNDDLGKTASLRDDQGRQARLLEWKGGKLGSHHRADTLKFAPLSPRPQSIELLIQRPGEAAPRVFKWSLQ